jgi:UDP-N-acetyl-D-glucosamine dehydrogenase
MHSALPGPEQVDLVVVGLGYVGLPLAHTAARAGLRVLGLDVDARRVADVNAGRSHIDDLSDEDLATMRAGGFTATTDPAVLGAAEVIVICVPTPMGGPLGPDLHAVTSACEVIAAHLQPGTLVVLESTTYPGTTDEVVLPLLETSGLTGGRDFHLAFSPERIDPGNDTFTVANTPKVVGGHTAACADAAVAFYGKLVDTVVRAKGTREAEMAKLLENTYRHVNIALVNEMAVFCDELGIDLWDSIGLAATKPFGFQPFYPGPGVGGHCIPIDPNYLAYKVRTLGYPFRFVELAQEINDRMPAYVASRVIRLLNAHRKPVNGARILLLGVTYKADVGDDRESPAKPLARRLLELGADLSYHDPYVESWSVNGSTVTRADDPVEAAAQADLVVLVQAHAAYDFAAITTAAPLIFDARGSLDGDNVERL